VSANVARIGKNLLHDQFLTVEHFCAARKCIIRGKEKQCFRCLGDDKNLSLGCVCDGKFDCSDFSDEFFCTKKRHKYKSSLHRLTIIQQFGLGYESKESSVDLALRTCLPYSSMTSNYRQACKHCRIGEIQCSLLRNKTDAITCVSKDQLCNGREDCPEGEDERYCSPSECLLSILPFYR